MASREIGRRSEDAALSGRMTRPELLVGAKEILRSRPLFVKSRRVPEEVPPTTRP